jgi:poly-gamma-glutamate capsule biosynthesis protein CapA/YwtB (metallophosphatase superfamily)
MSNAPVTIAAVGDIVLSRPMPAVGVGGGFEETRALLAGADVVIGSLEMPYSERGAGKDKITCFRSAPELAQGLTALNLGVASLANNHSFDYGWPALSDTIDRITELGIAHVGGGATLADAQRGHVLELGGMRIGVLAWSCLLPLGIAAGEQRPGVAPIHVRTSWDVKPDYLLEEPGLPPAIRTHAEPADIARVTERIGAMRGEVDFLAVALHWGFGSGGELAEYQRPLGRALVDAGADVILGQHVHAPQAVEAYRGKAIVYSPGNFVAQQPREGISQEVVEIYDGMSRDGFVCVLEIDASANYELRLVPYSGGPDGLPAIAHGRDLERVAETVALLSANLGTTVALEGSSLAVSL